MIKDLSKANQRQGKARLVKKLAIVSGLFITGLFLTVLTVFHLMPLQIIEGLIKDTLKERSGLQFSATELERSFPFGITMKGFELSDTAGRPLARLDGLKASLTGFKVSFSGRAGDGTVEGVLSPGLSGPGLTLELKGIGFDHLPALADSGMGLSGAFDSSVVIDMIDGCPSGFVRIEGVDMDGGELKFRGIPLPIGAIDEAGASIEFRDCKALVHGVWIDGTDLSAKLQGEITIARPASSSAVDLTLELIPRGSLLEKEYMLSVISSYRKSANYYSIPIRGTLGSIRPGR